MFCLYPVLGIPIPLGFGVSFQSCSVRLLYSTFRLSKPIQWLEVGMYLGLLKRANVFFMSPCHFFYAGFEPESNIFKVIMCPETTTTVVMKYEFLMAFPTVIHHHRVHFRTPLDLIVTSSFGSHKVGSHCYNIL